MSSVDPSSVSGANYHKLEEGTKQTTTGSAPKTAPAKQPSATIPVSVDKSILNQKKPEKLTIGAFKFYVLKDTLYSFPKGAEALKYVPEGRRSGHYEVNSKQNLDHAESSKVVTEFFKAAKSNSAEVSAFVSDYVKKNGGKPIDTAQKVTELAMQYHNAHIQKK